MRNFLGAFSYSVDLSGIFAPWTLSLDLQRQFCCKCCPFHRASLLKFAIWTKCFQNDERCEYNQMIWRRGTLHKQSGKDNLSNFFSRGPAVSRILFQDRYYVFSISFQDRVIKFCPSRHIPVAFLQGRSHGASSCDRTLFFWLFWLQSICKSTPWQMWRGNFQMGMVIVLCSL